MPILNPDSLKIGYIILVANPKSAVRVIQHKAGYGDSSKWTHVAGSLGGYDAIEAAVPKSRVINLKKEYADKGIEVKVMRRRGQDEHRRYKVALWWATMNNLPYDTLQFFWFPLSLAWARAYYILHRLFSSSKRFLCSELIATGFYKEGDYLFGKPVENVLPADFDNVELFEEVKDIWQWSPPGLNRLGQMNTRFLKVERSNHKIFCLRHNFPQFSSIQLKWGEKIF